MKHAATATIVLASLLGTGMAIAQLQSPADSQPVTISGIETVCTGTTTDVRADPQWHAYPFHLEFAWNSGEYLGDEQVTVTGNGHSVSVHCAGPWVLMKLPSGTYRVSADVPDGGHRDFSMSVPGRTVLHFPGGPGAERVAVR